MKTATACLALTGRELTAIRRARSQLYSSVVTPLLILVLLGTGVSRGLEPSTLTGGGFTAFLAAGAAIMTSLFSSTFTGASFYRDRESGMLRMVLVSPHSPRVLLAGKAGAGIIVGAAQAALVLAVAAPFVDFQWQYGVGTGIAVALAAIVLVNVVLAGVAQALSTQISTMQGFHLVMNLVLFPLLFISGAFFPLEELPMWLKVMAWMNPLTYAVDALQLATYAEGGTGFIGLPIDFAVLAAASVAIHAAGLMRIPRLTWSGE